MSQPETTNSANSRSETWVPPKMPPKFEVWWYFHVFEPLMTHAWFTVSRILALSSI